MDKDRSGNSMYISEFLSFLRKVQTEYNIAAEREKDADEETQDILHRLELEEDSLQDMEKMTEALKEVRRRRREAKDSKMMSEPVMDWLLKNKEMVNSLEQVLGEVRKIEKRIRNRTYTEKTGIVEEIFKNSCMEDSGTEESGVVCGGTEKERL